MAERQLIQELQQSRPVLTPFRPSNDSPRRPEPFNYDTQRRPELINKAQAPTIDDINNSQTINDFNPNRNQVNRQPQRPTNIYFPSADSDSQFTSRQPLKDPFQTQNTGFNRPIPKDREREEYRGNNAVTEFAWNLFKNSNTQQNFVLSPMSIQILLSYLAWVADGQTRTELVGSNGYGHPKQIQKIVQSMLADGSGRELQIASAIFVAKDMRLNQEFLDGSVKYADVVPVDFMQPQVASRSIAKWATEKTKGGLKLAEINYSPSTKVALANAVYFKGNWLYTFHPAQPGIFYAPQGTVQAEMMNMKRKFHWGKIGNIAEWVALPYESQDSLIIILPNIDQNIDNVINSMTYRQFDEVMFGIESESKRADVNITMPKFKLESTTGLVEPLQRVRRQKVILSTTFSIHFILNQMGITTLFTPRAQMPYLSDYDSVQVSAAQQQASMEVNEAGTVLIAITNINVVALSFQPPVPNVEFNVNRPFIAVIADRSKNIPFVMAKITNPVA